MSDKPLLSQFDVLCLGTNAIVGSGIYIFPGILAGLLGPGSFLAFGLCGLLSALIGLCYAEAAGMYERSGGPYVYAQDAFGGVVGFLVGWTCWIAALVSWAAVSRAIPPYLGHLWSPLGTEMGGMLVAVCITLFLGAINYWGIKPGAYTMDLLTVAKLMPLVILAAVGLIRRGAHLPRSMFPLGLGGMPKAIFTAFFAFQGFEVVPVPASETKNPRRNAPIAVLGSLVLATILYMAVQWTAVASEPLLARFNDQPLARMGQVLLGDLGRQLVSAAAVVSMLGFCAGVALTGPRYLEPLSVDEHLQPLLARRHPRYGTPHVSVLVTTLLTGLLVVLLSFSRLVSLSVLAVSFQYILTCLSVLVLRWRRPDLERTFLLPAGPVIPLLAAGVSIWIGSQAELPELAGFGVLLVAGLLLKISQRSAHRRDRSLP